MQITFFSQQTILTHDNQSSATDLITYSLASAEAHAHQSVSSHDELSDVRGHGCKGCVVGKAGGVWGYVRGWGGGGGGGLCNRQRCPSGRFHMDSGN